jgi:ABC-type multidrug transport system fused ATPase/permease subunit
MPLMTIVFGNVVDSFSTFIPVKTNPKTLEDAIIQSVTYFLLLALVDFITAYGAQAMFMVAGENQTRRIRQKFLRATMYQEICFFDTHTSGHITTRVTADTAFIQEVRQQNFQRRSENKISIKKTIREETVGSLTYRFHIFYQQGIFEKVSVTVQYFATFFAAFIAPRLLWHLCRAGSWPWSLPQLGLSSAFVR